MVRAVKDRMGWDYNISVKIRVDPDLKCVWHCLPILMTRALWLRLCLG